MKLMRAALKYLGERVKKKKSKHAGIVTQFVTEQIMVHW